MNIPVLKEQRYRSFNIILGCIICLTMYSPLSHAAVGDLILDSTIILRENIENTTLLKEGYALSLDNIQFSQSPQDTVIFLTLYKNGNVIQKIQVNDNDLFICNTTLNGTKYTIIQSKINLVYGMSGKNFIELEPFLQYSDGTAYEPFIADTIFQVPGINAPVEEWNKTFGGPYHEESPQFLLHTPDEGYTIAGQRSSYHGNQYQNTIWLIHIDTMGSEQWNRTLEDVEGYGYSINQTHDGGYIILGRSSYSEDWDYKDSYLIKLDENGEEQWKKTIGNLNPPYSIMQTTDGGYIIAAFKHTRKEGNIVTRLIKTDKQGREQWSKNLPRFTFWRYFMVRQTGDGGYTLAGNYILAGDYCSDDINFSEIRLFKTDTDGNEQWNLTFGGNDDQYFNSFMQTREGGYVFAGSTGACGNHDAWLVKTDAYGHEQWNKTFGLGGFDSANSVLQTSDGGYILAGNIDTAKNPDFKDQIWYENQDAWLIKTDFHGNLEWSKIFGGLRDDRASSVRETVDGGYILVGSTHSYGTGDIWMIKIADTERGTSQISEYNGTEPIQIAEVNETGIPAKTMPGFEFVEVLISIILLLFLHMKFIKMVKKG